LEFYTVGKGSWKKGEVGKKEKLENIKWGN